MRDAFPLHREVGNSTLWNQSGRGMVWPYFVKCPTNKPSSCWPPDISRTHLFNLTVSATVIMIIIIGNIVRVTGPFWGEFTDHWWFPSKRPVALSVDVFFDLCLNKRLTKQSRHRSFETPSRSLKRNCNDWVGWSKSGRPRWAATGKFSHGNRLALQRCHMNAQTTDYLLKDYWATNPPKHCNFTSLALCGGISLVIGGFPHRGPVRRKVFPCVDVISGVRWLSQ